MALSTTIKTIQDIMRQDAGVDGDAQRISQLVWMIFLKVFDDTEREREYFDPGYVSPVPEALRWRAWAADDEGITGDQLLDFVNNTLFPQLKELEVGPAADPRAAIVRSIFADSHNYMKSGTLLRQVANKINEIDFSRQEDRHLFNDLYEQVLRDLQSAGNAGEYYTPRAVTQFMVDMTDPKLGDRVLDPACGTGGFLICALEHVRSRYVKSMADEELLQRSIVGIEKKPMPHMLCVTNMILHDVPVPTILRDNSLARRPLRDYGAADQVEVILTNPPFGGTEEPGVETNFPSAYQTKETADLFLALILKLLAPKGRAAIVLPDGSLFGEGVKTRIKEALLQECNLHTIVRLPNGVFAPYTGINTNLLFFTKGQPTEAVWYFEHPLPTDRKQYSKTRPIEIGEFGLEKAWWDAREESEHAWRVPIDEIKARGYNLDISNPNAPDEDLGDPDRLLARYHAHLAKAAELRAELKAELAEAIERVLYEG